MNHDLYTKILQKQNDAGSSFLSKTVYKKNKNGMCFSQKTLISLFRWNKIRRL